MTSMQITRTARDLTKSVSKKLFCMTLFTLILATHEKLNFQESEDCFPVLSIGDK